MVSSTESHPKVFFLSPKKKTSKARIWHRTNPLCLLDIFSSSPSLLFCVILLRSAGEHIITLTIICNQAPTGSHSDAEQGGWKSEGDQRHRKTAKPWGPWSRCHDEPIGLKLATPALLNRGMFVFVCFFLSTMQSKLHQFPRHLPSQAANPVTWCPVDNYAVRVHAWRTADRGSCPGPDWMLFSLCQWDTLESFACSEAKTRLSARHQLRPMCSVRNVAIAEKWTEPNEMHLLLRLHCSPMHPRAKIYDFVFALDCVWCCHSC